MNNTWGLWDEWRKGLLGLGDPTKERELNEDGTYGSSADLSNRTVNRFDRNNLSTAGGVDNSGASANMDKRTPRKRGDFPTYPKHIRQKKEVRDRLGRVVEPGSPINAPGNVSHPMMNKNFPVTPQDARKTPQKTPFHPSQGGDLKYHGGDQQDQLNWWQKLAGKMNIDFDKAAANWKEKGGFEGLMANPAFTMGLAFMQAGAEGKTLGAGALDNVMKAGGISQHYKKIIEDRKLEPIQATASDIGEVKDMLKSINIEEGNWIENLIHGPKSGAKYEAAVEEIAVKFQEEIRKKQKALKDAGESQIIRRTDQIAILERLVNSKKIKKKGSWLSKIGITSETLQMDLPNKAQGGPVQQGKPYVVGEQGPEIIIPRSDGDVLTNDDSQIYAMLLASNPQLQKVSRVRAQKIMRNRFPEYFEG